MFATIQDESPTFFSDPTVYGDNDIIPLSLNVRGFVFVPDRLTAAPAHCQRSRVTYVLSFLARFPSTTDIA